jgi:hypothetical protein
VETVKQEWKRQVFIICRRHPHSHRKYGGSSVTSLHSMKLERWRVCKMFVLDWNKESALQLGEPQNHLDITTKGKVLAFSELNPVVRVVACPHILAMAADGLVLSPYRSTDSLGFLLHPHCRHDAVAVRNPVPQSKFLVYRRNKFACTRTHARSSKINIFLGLSLRQEHFLSILFLLRGDWTPVMLATIRSRNFVLASAV